MQPCNNNCPFEEVTPIPTEAVYEQSKLGSCKLCKPYGIARHTLDPQRLQLENRMLRREIELLDKAQEFGCCDNEEGDTDGEE